MAIAFARLEFVKRSSGKTACGKAAYNSRERIHCEGNEFHKPKTYDWTHKPKPIFHEILLPDHVDEKYKSSEILWNAVEQKETRKNSQLASEMVLALPDDQAISTEDRITLAKTFVQEHFIKKGLAAQLDIHQPEERETLSEKTGEIVKQQHNWHAHILITTRRFKENGQEFEDHKARDLMPTIRKGRVVSARDNGKAWAIHQNQYFEEKGLSLRVDSEGIVPQKHLGPVRMRGRAFSLLNENNLLVSLNQLEARDPSKILEKLTETQNIFTPGDVERFLHKHVEAQHIPEIQKAFWKQGAVVSLLDRETKQATGKYTTHQIIEEEKRALRLADRSFEKKAFKIKENTDLKTHSQNLTKEQKKAFDQIVQGSRLSCVEGHAGTGKSYLLSALKNVYESQGYVVRAFGPDSATAQVLKDKGFKSSENIYRFLFAHKNEKRKIQKNQEVWILDEAGKLGTRPFGELLKIAEKEGVQVVLSGSSSQLPSVERGSMFKSLCERRQASYLEDIQRQKEEHQREVTKSLAHGKMGEAIDSIINQGSLNWTSTKEESIEALVREWAEDREKTPHRSSLIIAHKNTEMRALNEMVRLVRKEEGEISQKEYQCETTLGKIYISEGDRVEFRKNNKELGVTNGQTGVLIKASQKRFIVQTKEREKTRNITFDPREYSSFQLGYATTYFRSQGRTVDQAYVLLSPHMNKEMFYVGLTRHVREVNLFVSQTDAKNLAQLKQRAYVQSQRESTLDFLTEGQIKETEQVEKKRETIQALKESGSILTRLKGHGLSAFGGLQTKTKTLLERFEDRRSDERFFNPRLGKDREIATISVVDQKAHEQKFGEEEKLKVETKIEKPIKPQVDVKPMKNKPLIEKGLSWKRLSDAEKKLLREYFKTIDGASTLHAVVKAEAELHSDGEKEGHHFQNWQEACAKRNESGYVLVHSTSEKKLRQVLGGKGYEILQEQASRHETLLERGRSKRVDLDEKLKGNLEPLLQRLFPEGPTRRDNKGLRFGGKGSLAVTCTGSKAGIFYDFENQEGGGPLQLIQKTLNLDNTEAREWAKGFLGEAKEVFVPMQFKFKHKEGEREQEWVSMKPDSKASAPSLQKISYELSLVYGESARYTYRDEKGNELFHVLRLEEKGDLKEKITLSLSYGYWKGGEGKPQWSLNGYQAERQPLYNLHLLKKHPSAKVLVVEGEKTTEGAMKRFAGEKMICISWSGGASAVRKSDWSPLLGREVVVWPDNDRAGHRAAEDVCGVLRKVGVKSLECVDEKLLAKELPQKWDLADPLPKGKEEGFVQDFLLRAREKGVGVDSLMNHLGEKGSVEGRGLAHEILWRVEERLRPGLEEKFGGKSWEIRNEILDEASKVLGDARQMRVRLGKGIGESLAGEFSQRAAVYQAATGKQANERQLREMGDSSALGVNTIAGEREVGLCVEVVDRQADRGMSI